MYLFYFNFYFLHLFIAIHFIYYANYVLNDKIDQC